MVRERGTRNPPYWAGNKELLSSGFIIRKVRAVLANTRLIRGKVFLGIVPSWPEVPDDSSHLAVNGVYETRSSNLK